MKRGQHPESGGFIQIRKGLNVTGAADLAVTDNLFIIRKIYPG
jgi:hypothetical protein